MDVRIKAVSLIGKLFALQENHIVDKYHDLFMEFLKRFSDKSAEVRVIVLQSAKVFYLANPTGKESREVLSKLSGLCVPEFCFSCLLILEALYFSQTLS